MKKLMTATIAALSILCSATASAGPVFDVTAMTTLATNPSGRGTFTPMSVLLGSIELTDAAAARIMAGMSTTFGTADIASFQFTVGALTLTRATAMNVDFTATLSGDGSSFSLFRLLFTTPMGVGGCDLLCTSEFGRFANARTVVNISSQSAGLVLDQFSARFSFARRQVAEPSVLGLLAFGLLGAAVTRRARAR